MKWARSVVADLHCVFMVISISPGIFPSFHLSTCHSPVNFWLLSNSQYPSFSPFLGKSALNSLPSPFLSLVQLGLVNHFFFANRETEAKISEIDSELLWINEQAGTPASRVLSKRDQCSFPTPFQWLIWARQQSYLCYISTPSSLLGSHTRSTHPPPPPMLWGAEKDTRGSLEGERTGNQVKGDVCMERSKDDDKSIMKKEQREGAKKRGAQPGAAAAPGGEREAAATYFVFICAARGSVCLGVCVLGEVVTAGGLCAA